MSKSKPLPEGPRKLEPSELARLMRENAEAFVQKFGREKIFTAPSIPTARRAGEVVLRLIASRELPRRGYLELP